MPSKRLSTRITLAFVALGIAVTFFMGFAVVTALKAVEAQILDEALQAELTDYRHRHSQSASLLEFKSRNTSVYIVPPDSTMDAPQHLRTLSIGNHDVEVENRSYRVLVDQDGNSRYFIEFDTTDINAREAQFVRAVWLIGAVTLLVAFGLASYLARRVSAPITRLANDVMKLEEEPAVNIDMTRFEDDEIGMLAEQIRRYHDQLTELLLREREFASNVSHELRTPVTNISLAAEVLAASKELPEKQLTRVRRIQRAAREMTELIETFLVLAKADSAEAETDSAVSVNPIVKDVVEQQRVWLHEKPVEVVVNEYGDLSVGAPGRVIAVLAANLVRNAFRYTGRGSVEISIYVDRLTVDDTGPGIVESSAEKLFERHERGLAVDPDGFGLGLSIVRRICERFGWLAVVENRASGGTRFVVIFSEEGSQQPKATEYAADGMLTNS